MIHRAFLLIDVIKDFMDPKGTNYHKEYDIVLKNILTSLKIAREHMLMVVHIKETHLSTHHRDFEFEKIGPHCLSGSMNTEWATGITISENEYIRTKRRYSAFFETDLNLLLREKDIQQVIIVGVKSHVCIRATVQDAFGWGYKPIVIREAVGSNYQQLHEASLEDIDRYMGTVISLNDFVNLVKSNYGEKSGKK